MPQIVSSYIKDKDYGKVRNIQSIILMQYERDFGKHAKDNELIKIRMLWNSIPSQLSKENKKIFFSSIKKGARLKEYESAIEWL